jgi:hypothetical protein
VLGRALGWSGLGSGLDSAGLSATFGSVLCLDLGSGLGSVVGSWLGRALS